MSFPEDEIDWEGGLPLWVQWARPVVFLAICGLIALFWLWVYS